VLGWRGSDRCHGALVGTDFTMADNESDDEIRDTAAKAILQQIGELAPRASAEDLQKLADAFASVVYSKSGH
jgi:hypothetical protein